MQYAKKYANFFVMKDRLALNKEKEAAFETTENDSAVVNKEFYGIIKDIAKDVRSSGKKSESLNMTRKRRQENEKILEDQLKEANHRFLKENNKFEHLITSIQRLRDKYEEEFQNFNNQ